jgi:hypothetical protein
MLEGWATGETPDIGDLHRVAHPHR